MEMKSQESIQEHSNVNKPWWDAPLWGNNSLREKIVDFFHRELIPEETISLHDSTLEELKKYAPLVEGLDNAKFGNAEFILLLRIKSYFLKGTGHYAGLSEPNEMVHAAFEAKDSFLKIEQTEFQFRSYKQQDYYEEIFKLLEQNMTKVRFEQKVQVLAENTMQNLKTQEGVDAIRSYSQELKKLSYEHQLGLRLLYLFKKSELSDFSVLQKLSNLVNALKKEDLNDMKRILVQVKLNYTAFEKLGRIVGITGKNNTPETYAKIIQHIALTEKHKESYIQFQQLLFHLRKWENVYNTLTTLREEYPSKSYKQPKSFRETIPGTPLYKKYQPWLVLSRYHGTTFTEDD